MTDNQNIFPNLQLLCQQQNEKLIMQNVQIWDLEEEIRVLREHNSNLQSSIAKYQDKIKEYELWCDHQQSVINSKEIATIQMEKSLEFYKSRVTSLEDRLTVFQKWSEYIKKFKKKHSFFYKVLQKLSTRLHRHKV